MAEPFHPGPSPVRRNQTACHTKSDVGVAGIVENFQRSQPGHCKHQTQSGMRYFARVSELVQSPYTDVYFHKFRMVKTLKWLRSKDDVS